MIDYKIIDESISYYETLGFKRIETNWLVSESVNNLTMPKDVSPLKIENSDECLVGSGEQSFLQLYMLESLPLGRFQTVTPCFRNDKLDFTHSRHFMKNELIITDNVNIDMLQVVVENCLIFFGGYVERSELEIAHTQEGMDILLRGVEIGSYGIRQCSYLKWIYATGLAEPRFSKILNNIRYGISY